MVKLPFLLHPSSLWVVYPVSHPPSSLSNKMHSRYVLETYWPVFN